ncbi:hypothetical protein QAD02_003321 [Eretmocerus hayati]|uniref:Uncharacterized protein n=1 Tax=Eretmocerus hayati TaxID=131215 RepID=A0ACC2NLS5_9HYME|nr:hypothetical protein QAD02_003321 [Eretmocerus hayati]
MRVKTKLPQEEEHRRRRKYQLASERRLEDRTGQCKTTSKSGTRFPKAAARTTKEAMRSYLKRWRLESFPPHPKTFKEFCKQVREERYTSILKSMHAKLEAHVKVDDDGEEHIIYYDRDYVQEVMRNTKYFFLDGTFQCRPGRMKGIAQIFNVMGIKLGRAAVMFEVLMSRRTQKSYEAVFKHIKEVCEFSELTVTMCDFEQPMRAAFSVYWPEVSVVGCNVHFDRALYQKLKELKVDMNNEDVKKNINWILALAFLPSDLIQETYDDIKEGMPFPIRCILEKFLEYFERFWLGIVKPDGFPIFGLFQRSNNISEQLNSKYLQYMGRGPTSCEYSRDDIDFDHSLFLPEIEVRQQNLGQRLLKLRKKQAERLRLREREDGDSAIDVESNAGAESQENGDDIDEANAIENNDEENVIVDSDSEEDSSNEGCSPGEEEISSEDDLNLEHNTKKKIDRSGK